VNNRQRDAAGLAVVVAAVAAVMLYRATYLEPVIWGTLCAAASPPLACVPRAALMWLQGHYLMGIASLAFGLWGFAWRGGFGVQLAAIVAGIAALDNYNATWGALGAALGAWGWVSRDSWRAKGASFRVF